MADLTTPETTIPTYTDTTLGSEQVDVQIQDGAEMSPSPSAEPTSTNDTTIKPDITTSISDWFNQQNLTYFIVFLGVYLIIYFILGKFVNTTATAIPSNFNMVLSWSIDLIFTGVLVISLISLYYGYNVNSNLPNEMYNTATDFISNPNSIVITGLFIISFYMVIHMFRLPTDADTKPLFISLIENTAWIVFIFILIWDFFKYILKISLFDLFPVLGSRTEEPTTETSPETVPVVPTDANEVFNIGNNVYSYDDARAVCSIYDAELATYDQVETSYNNGAEWCNYGWSAGQMALFPTQKETWAKLQLRDTESIGKPAYVSHKNDCGRPGINGGYIDNPYVKFGVNCYGKKPTPSDTDLRRMRTNQTHIRPTTPADAVLETKVRYWKENKDQLLRLNPYNLQQWSKNE